MIITLPLGLSKYRMGVPIGSLYPLHGTITMLKPLTFYQSQDSFINSFSEFARCSQTPRSSKFEFVYQLWNREKSSFEILKPIKEYCLKPNRLNPINLYACSKQNPKIQANNIFKFWILPNPTSKSSNGVSISKSTTSNPILRSTNPKSQIQNPNHFLKNLFHNSPKPARENSITKPKVPF